MNKNFRKLEELGAGDFVHLNGSLLEHLEGTSRLLASWNAPSVLQEAGLYHAAYGTAGFESNFVSLTQRQKISDIIGIEAEVIVYQYCACDRDYFWPNFLEENNPEYRDRFTGKTFYLKNDQIRNFCELTVANEVEIALDNPGFIDKHGQQLAALAKSMERYITGKASEAAKDAFVNQ